jgi:hypothetical protein
VWLDDREGLILCFACTYGFGQGDIWEFGAVRGQKINLYLFSAVLTHP